MEELHALLNHDGIERIHRRARQPCCTRETFLPLGCVHERSLSQSEKRSSDHDHERGLEAVATFASFVAYI